MCIMCVEIIKQKLSLTEASRNLGEVVNSTKESPETLTHYRKLKEAVDLLDREKLDEVLNEGSK